VAAAQLRQQRLQRGPAAAVLLAVAIACDPVVHGRITTGFGAFGELHAEPVARDLVDAVAFGPGGLLQLQPAEFDVEFVARALQAAELHEELAMLVARVHHRQRRD
jgi:hypothetical protein